MSVLVMLIRIVGIWVVITAAAFIAHTIGLTIEESIKIGLAALALTVGVGMLGGGRR